LFKWIKQHLRIKAFFGASENAVKIQIWIAVSVYVLVAIIRKQLGVEPLPNLGQAETEIADKFSLAANTYRDNPVALHLRAMNMLYEAIKEKGSLVIVPSSAVETMGLGGMLATASLGGAKLQ